MDQPIGITFMPTADAQAQGPQRGGMEGDLQRAFKIISLHLPRTQGAHALAPQRLLESPGASGFRGMNPHAAVFEALLKASAGGRPDLFNALPQPGTGGPTLPTAPGPTAPSSPTATAGPVAQQPYSSPAPSASPIVQPYDPGPSAMSAQVQASAAPPAPHVTAGQKAPPPGSYTPAPNLPSWPVAPPITMDPRQSAGFRQHEPGLFTNAAGEFYVPDANGPYGARRLGSIAEFYQANPSTPGGY